MKTFLGFTTGLLGGTLIGAFGVIVVLLTSPDVRKVLNDTADEIDYKD